MSTNLVLGMRDECLGVPLDVETLTEEEAQGVCAKLHYQFVLVSKLDELTVLSEYLRRALRNMQCQRVGQILNTPSKRWKKHPMSSRAYAELQIAMMEVGFAMPSWDDLREDPRDLSGYQF